MLSSPHMAPKKTEKHPVTVVSLGGSIIAPDVPDADFVKSFVALIRERVEAGRRFVIITGGGKTCRNYQKALAEVAPVSAADNDWMGIYATRLNGELMRLAFGKLAHKELWIAFKKKPATKNAVIVGAGEAPGHSTDFDAILAAGHVGARTVVNVSNIDYVYTADPKKDPNARALPQMTWEDLTDILPKDWTPGLSTPFDPIAARMAQKLKLTVSIVNGASLADVTRALDGLPFRGTVITG